MRGKINQNQQVVSNRWNPSLYTTHNSYEKVVKLHTQNGFLSMNFIVSIGRINPKTALLCWRAEVASTLPNLPDAFLCFGIFSFTSIQKSIDGELNASYQFPMPTPRWHLAGSYSPGVWQRIMTIDRYKELIRITSKY